MDYKLNTIIFTLAGAVFLYIAVTKFMDDAGFLSVFLNGLAGACFIGVGIVAFLKKGKNSTEQQ